MAMDSATMNKRREVVGWSVDETVTNARGITTSGFTRDFVGHGRTPDDVVWPGNKKLALNIVVNYEEGSENSVLLGDAAGDPPSEILAAPSLLSAIPGKRDLHAESSFEYGSRAGIWRLARIFDELDLRTTIFACALSLELNPEVGAYIQERKHEPCSHGWRWGGIQSWEMTESEELALIERTVESIERTCGTRPVGWYCRRSPSLNTRRLLMQTGFLYDSDSYGDDLPYFVDVDGDRHLVVPYNLTYNDGRYNIPQGYSTPDDFVSDCKRAIDFYCAEAETTVPKMMTIGLHARLSGQAARASAVKEILEYVLERGDVWIATREEIAEWWMKR